MKTPERQARHLEALPRVLSANPGAQHCNSMPGYSRLIALCYLLRYVRSNIVTSGVTCGTDSGLLEYPLPRHIFGRGVVELSTRVKVGFEVAPKRLVVFSEHHSDFVYGIRGRRPVTV